jgi:two-component system chemotaxis response regulator CheB
MMRRLVAAWVEEAPGLEYVGEASDGREAVELVTSVAPDVLVLDLDMPVYDGVFAIRELRAADQGLPIVVFSGSSGTAMRDSALAAGATMVVSKHEPSEILIAAVRDAVAAAGA